MSEESAREIVNGTGGSEVIGRAYEIILEPFLPEFRRMLRPGSATTAGKRLDWLSKGAARGIVEAFEAGLIDDDIWLQIAPAYEAIVATAELD